MLLSDSSCVHRKKVKKWRSKNDALLTCTLYFCAYSHFKALAVKWWIINLFNVFFLLLIFLFIWNDDLTKWSLDSVFQMFCPFVGVIQCCDAKDATEAQKSKFSLHPHIPLPSLSVLLSVFLWSWTLLKLSSRHCFNISKALVTKWPLIMLYVIYFRDLFFLPFGELLLGLARFPSPSMK